METNRHYFLVGIFVLVTAILALVFCVWLTSSNSGDYTKYHVRFGESVSGLSVGGAVKYRGVDVGTVESIVIDPHDRQLILVTITVLKDTPIKTDTEASLKLQGITGVVFIELSGGSSHAPMMKNDEDDDRIPVIKAKSSTISAIVDRLPEILDRISHTMEQINKVVSDENVATMTQILSDTQTLVKNASAAAADIHQMSSNSKTSINETVANLNRSSQELDSLMRDFKKTSRNVSGLAEGLNEDPSRLIFPAPQKGVPAP